MRIWHQSATELDAEGPYARSLVARATAVAPEIALHVNGFPAGTYGGASPMLALRDAVEFDRLTRLILGFAQVADRHGFDAFVIGSFAEPSPQEIRKTVRIPVTSVTEAALLTGCMLGEHVGFIAPSPAVATMVDRSIARHRLQSRVAAVVSLTDSWTEQRLLEAFSDPDRLLADFSDAARLALAHGADVLVPAELILAQVIAGQGLTAIDGMTIIDPAACAWSQATLLARLAALRTPGRPNGP